MSFQKAVVSQETLDFARYEWVSMMRKNGYTNKQIINRVEGFADGEIKDQLIRSLWAKMPEVLWDRIREISER